MELFARSNKKNIFIWTARPLYSLLYKDILYTGQD